MKTEEQYREALEAKFLEPLAKELRHWNTELVKCTNEDQKVSLRVHQRVASLNYKTMDAAIKRQVEWARDYDFHILTRTRIPTDIHSKISEIPKDYPYWSFIKKYHPEYNKSIAVRNSDLFCRYLHGEELPKDTIDSIEKLGSIDKIKIDIYKMDMDSLKKSMDAYFEKCDEGLTYGDRTLREAYSAKYDVSFDVKFAMQSYAARKGVILFRRTAGTVQLFDNAYSCEHGEAYKAAERGNRLCVFSNKNIEGENKGNFFLMGRKSEDAAKILGKPFLEENVEEISPEYGILGSLFLFEPIKVVKMSKEEVDECIKKLEAAGYDVVKYKEIDCDLHDFCVQEVKDGQRQEPCMKGSMEECEAYIQDNGQGREFHIVSEENVVVDQTLNCKTQVSDEETESEEEEESEYRGFHR